MTSCPSLSPPEHGSVSSSVATHASTVIIKCDEGYMFDDETESAVLLCSEGTWNDSYGDCNGMYE